MGIREHRHIILLFLALVAAIGICPASAEPGRARLALVIGNATYDDAEAPLKDVIENVRAFADEVRRQGFEVELRENLSKQMMHSALEQFYGKISSGSVALIFFSGYGIQSYRQSYMLPVNAVIWSEQDVRRDGFNLDSVLAEMNSKGARIKIAIVDASRRNRFEPRLRSVPAGLAPVIAPNNAAVMYAAAPGMVMRETDRALFVTELLKEIRASGKVEDVFNRTQVSIQRRSLGEQAPWFSSSMLEDFSFVESTKTSATAASRSGR